VIPIQPLLKIDVLGLRHQQTNPRLESFRANRVPEKAKEPDWYDGKSKDFKDYIVHFEQIANWNAWDKSEMDQHLCMS
jgi:hypothetical protein